MSISDAVSRTIKCDAPECDKLVTFDPQVQADVIALPDWVRTLRNVQLGNRATFSYCSDVCEVKGVTTGNHNVPEPKQVEEATPAQAKLAAQQSDAVNQMRARPGDAAPRVSLS